MMLNAILSTGADRTYAVPWPPEIMDFHGLNELCEADSQMISGKVLKVPENGGSGHARRAIGWLPGRKPFVP